MIILQLSPYKKLTEKLFSEQLNILKVCNLFLE